MKTYNPQLKKHTRKMKLYNVGPLVTVDNIDKIETGIDTLDALKNKNNKDVWLTFVKNHITRFNSLPFPMEEQLPFLYYICNDEMQVQLCKQLNKISSFNPNTDPIPFDKLNDSLRNYLYKKQQLLTNINQIIKKEMFVKKNFVGIYYPEDFQIEIFNLLKFLGFDIIIFNKNKLDLFIDDREPKFYEIQGKKINIQNILDLLEDYCGKFKKNENRYSYENSLEKGDLLSIIKDNIE